MKLTIDWMEKLKLRKGLIKIVKINNLEGFNLDKLDLVKDWYFDYITYLEYHINKKINPDFTYDEHGNAINNINENKDQWIKTYNANGLPLTCQYENGGKWIITYDENNNNLTWNDTVFGMSYKYTYDKDDNLISLDMDDGVINLYTYYDNGNLRAINNDIFTYEYLNNRLYKMYKNNELILEIPPECFED